MAKGYKQKKIVKKLEEHGAVLAWNLAEQKVNALYAQCQQIGMPALFMAGQLVVCQTLLKAGDRTLALYKYIMELK